MQTKRKDCFVIPFLAGDGEVGGEKIASHHFIKKPLRHSVPPPLSGEALKLRGFAAKASTENIRIILCGCLASELAP